jgi:hypothetical protein
MSVSRVRSSILLGKDHCRVVFVPPKTGTRRTPSASGAIRWTNSPELPPGGIPNHVSKKSSARVAAAAERRSRRMKIVDEVPAGTPEAHGTSPRLVGPPKAHREWVPVFA